MPSTYSNIKIQLMATGENNTTWGNVTNINLGTALEEAIVGSADVTFASGNVTLTLTDTNASQTARHVRLRCTGVTGGSTRDLIVPAIEKPYLVQNDCLNSIVVKNATGTGVTVPAGKTMWVYNDGTNVVDAVNHLSSLTLGTALPVGQGGTGASTFTANGIIYGNTTSALLATAAGTTGQVLVGNTGGAPSWATLTGIGVTSFSGGTTGLTPASPTTGAITLAGTLGVANGGTGTATAFTAGSVVFAGASGVYSQDNANLFWDNTNNYLGVGTATPSAPFHVKLTTDRNARFLNAYSSVAIGSTTDVGAEAPLAFFANPITFVTNNVERMRIDASGNVGVATSTPTALLTVNGTAKVGEGVATNTSKFMVNTLSGVAAGIQLIQDANESWIIQNPASTNVLTFSNSGTERMRITAAGIVGVGTVIPASYSTRLAVVGGNLGVSEDGNTVTTIRASANGSNIGAYDATGAALTFSTAPSGGGETERMRINSTGLVGIGTNNPTVPLDVFNSSGGWIRFRNNSGEGELFADGAAALLGSVNAIPLLFRTGSVERMRITVAGDVGIGTTAPISKFEVTAGYITSGTVSSTGGAKILAGQWSGTEHLTTFGSEYSSGGPALGYAVWPSTTTFASFVSATSVSQPRTAYTLSGGSHIWYTGGTQTVAVGSPVTMTETMRIDGAGRVGIGTASPSSKLNVLDGDIEISATGLGNTLLSFNGTTASLTVNSSSAPLVFGTNSTERMRITSAGIVGINTSSPSSGLDVNSIAIWCGTKTASSGSGGNIRFRDDTGTFRYATGILGSPAETSYSIYDNVAANSRLTITSAGNVGIGTITPNNLLQSSYGVSASVPAAGTGGHGLAVGSSGYGLAAGALTSGNAYLQVTRWDTIATNYDLLLQPNGGNVGIGTTSPSAKLDVNGTGYFSDNVSIVRTNTAGSLTGLTINNAGTTAAYAGVQVSSGTVTSQFFNDANGNAVVAGAVLRTTTNHPFVFGTDATERMRITSAGDVGIGTTTPQRKLGIGGTTSAYMNFNPTTYRQFTVGSDANGFIIFDDVTAFYRMVIDTSGKVGFNVNAPSYPMEIRADAASSASYIGITNTTATGGSGAAGYLARAGSNFAYFYVRGDGTAYIDNATNNPLGFATNGAERMRLDGSGNLMVGKSTMADTTVGFSVVGNTSSSQYGAVTSTLAASTTGNQTFQVYSTGASAYRFYVDMAGTVFATSTTISAISDQRFKENVRDLDTGLETILALKPRRFDWKAGKGKDVRDDMGFIAQEVETVLPELIGGWKAGEGEPDDLKSVKAGDLIPVLVKAIQELTARVAQLEGK